MNTTGLSELSRRHFISGSLGATAMILTPRRLFAKETGFVPERGGLGGEDRGPISCAPLLGCNMRSRIIESIIEWRFR